MSIDYAAADRVFELSFAKLDRSNASMAFPKRGSLSDQFSQLFKGANAVSPTLPHRYTPMLASAGVEMWQRAIHSFLWSVALTDSSPLWSSVCGYYSSHFVMRAFAHSMGVFKSFKEKKVFQILVGNGQYVCSPLQWNSNQQGEHAFYWKAVKGHPRFLPNDLFRQNSERDPQSDSAHRTFANYTDHVDSFVSINIPSTREVVECVERISRIRLYSVTAPSRDDYPDLQNVQILAFQRIIAFHEFLDERVPKNRFWRAHRRPHWCRDVMRYQVDEQGAEQPLLS